MCLLVIFDVVEVVVVIVGVVVYLWWCVVGDDVLGFVCVGVRCFYCVFVVVVVWLLW